MQIALYPGSFDPITFGHLDIIKRSSKKFDKFYVGVIENIHKDSLFTIEERIAMAKEAVKDFENVHVISFTGLTVTCAKEIGATSLIRGLRAISDFEYELQLASTNRIIDPEIETMFLMAKTEYSFLSSSLVKELSFYDANVHDYVPAHVEKLLKQKKEENKNE